MASPKNDVPPKEDCSTLISSVHDTLYVLGGKWKLSIISALRGGPLRFNELQAALKNITPKILSKELKELELNEFVSRTVYATSPVTVEYALTEYSRTLNKVILALGEWGSQHKKRLKDCAKAKRAAAAAAQKN